MTHDEMVAVITAHRDGKTIQYRFRGETSGKWEDNSQPHWSFGTHEYRVKPEPKVFYVNIYSNSHTGSLYDNKELAEKRGRTFSGGLEYRTIKLVEEL